MSLIATPYARITQPPEEKPFTLDDGIAALRKVEWCARISHRSEETMTADSWERFISAVVLGHGDWSVTEHASVTVDFLVDRGITHEIVRHRLFSFTQESTRFVNYEKKMPPRFVVPSFPNTKGDSPTPDPWMYNLWCQVIEHADNAYRVIVRDGGTPQLARSVLPNALASRIIMTGNLRSWRHFLIMRTTKEAHPQMREVTIPLLAQFQECIPLLYADIAPNARQIDNLKLPR